MTNDNNQSFFDNQAQKYLDSKIPLSHGKVPCVKPAITRKNTAEKGLPREVRERIERLVLLRDKIYNCRTQKAFADLLTRRGLAMSLARWNNYERGSNVHREVEEFLASITPGLTIDWLRTGDRRGLSVDLDRRLYGTP